MTEFLNIGAIKCFFFFKRFISHVGVMLISRFASLVCEDCAKFKYLYTRLGV